MTPTSASNMSPRSPVSPVSPMSLGPLPFSDRAVADKTNAQKTTSPPSPSATTSASPSASASTPPAPALASAHRRSVSGSILSRFSFLRPTTTSDDGLDRGPEARSRNGGASPENVGSLGSPPTSPIHDQGGRDDDDENDPSSTSGQSPARDPPSKAIAVITQQKGRPRKGSLRKVALLGRGAQREKKETRSESSSGLRIVSRDDEALPSRGSSQLDGNYDQDKPTTSRSGQRQKKGTTKDSKHGDTQDPAETTPTSKHVATPDVEDTTPRPSSEGLAGRAATGMTPSTGDGASPEISPIEFSSRGANSPPLVTTTTTEQPSPTLTYQSTTDDDDVLSIHISSNPIPSKATKQNEPVGIGINLNGHGTYKTTSPPDIPSGESTLDSGSDSYFPPPSTNLLTSKTVASTSPYSLLPRRRALSNHRAKSPLSIATPRSASVLDPDFAYHLASSALAPPTSSSSSTSTTVRWGWTLLVLTWLTFVMGMGSCLGVWSWAWDVGETPYAPPELEDDDTLPIVGYYPALIILTGGVVAWVWVGVAWVGMKYFRHARMGGE